MPEDVQVLIKELHAAQASKNKKRRRDALCKLAVFDYENEMYEKAKRLFENCLSLDPKTKEANYYIALIEIQNKNYEKAREALKKELKINPKNKNAKTIIEKIEINANLPLVTITLLLLNTLVFLFTFPQTTLLQMTKYTLTSLSLSIPSIISSIFFHYNALHFAMNMSMLLLFGLLFEKKSGSLPFLAIFLSAGLIGNLTQALLIPNSFVLGASAGVFGIIGGFLMREPLLKVRLFAIINIPLILFLGGFFVIVQLIQTLLNLPIFLADMAHMTGLLTGIFITALIYQETIRVFYNWFTITMGFSLLSFTIKSTLYQYKTISVQSGALLFGLSIIALIAICYSYKKLKLMIAYTTKNKNETSN